MKSNPTTPPSSCTVDSPAPSIAVRPVLRRLRVWLACYVAIAVAGLVWPVSLSYWNSQVLGVLMLLPCLLVARHWRALWQDVPRSARVAFALLLGILLVHALFDEAPMGLSTFSIYLLKIPLLFVLLHGACQTLQAAGWRRAQVLGVLWLAVCVPLAFVIAQWLLPTFQQWSMMSLGGPRVQEIIERATYGHQFRFLGPNGFLFASHGVAFALTALGLGVLRAQCPAPQRVLWLFAIELLCIVLALLSGRSALPLVGLYLLLSLYLMPGWPKRVALVLAYLLAAVTTHQILEQSAAGRQFNYWLLEPIYTTLDRGKPSSHSFDETIESYRGETSALRNAAVATDWKTVYGHAVYARQNTDYYAAGLQPSDSGYVRMIYVLGYLGLACFLWFWLRLGLRTWQNMGAQPRLARGLMVVLLAYGLLFFVKSEWLYQNFFVVYFFSIFLLSRPSAATHAHLLRSGLPAAAGLAHDQVRPGLDAERR